MKIALKDNISTKDFKTACGSKMLENYTPVFNAAVVDKLKRAGMTVAGKLAMDELGIIGDSAACAAAVANGDVPLSIGSGDDLKHCSTYGVTGIKPTYGAVSRYGIIGTSLGQITAIGRNINDCAALISAISGPCEFDGTCVLEKPFNFGDDCGNTSLDGVKIGVTRGFLDSETAHVSSEFKSAGASVEEFDIPLADYVEPAFRILNCAEISSNLARFDGLEFGHLSESAETLNDVYKLSRGEGFGYDVKLQIMLGTLVLSADCYDAYYRKALQARELIKREYDKLFGRFDFLLTSAADGDCDAAVNLAGLPVVALPCGENGGVGFYLIGGAFSDEKLVNAARIYQNRTGGAAL